MRLGVVGLALHDRFLVSLPFQEQTDGRHQFSTHDSRPPTWGSLRHEAPRKNGRRDERAECELLPALVRMDLSCQSVASKFEGLALHFVAMLLLTFCHLDDPVGKSRDNPTILS